MDNVKKNILIVYQFFGTQNSLWSTRWYDFAKCFSEKGYNVTILTSNFIRSDLKKSSYGYRTKIEDLNVIVLPFGVGNNYNTPRRIVNSIMFGVFSAIYVAFSRYSRIIFSSGPISAALGLLTRRKSAVNILEIRDLWPEGGIVMNKIPGIFVTPLMYLQKLLYTKADFLVTCSPKQNIIITNAYPNFIDKTLTIEHGVDGRVRGLANDMTSSVKPSVRYWSVVATLGFIHNPMKWLDLAVRLSTIDEKVKVVLIGSGPLEQELLRRIEMDGIKNVIMTGQLNKEMMTRWILDSEFCLFSTLDNYVQRSSAPNKIYDYIACEKPILVDLDMWHLQEYSEFVWMVDFENLSHEDIQELRRLKENLSPEVFGKVARSLDRGKLSEEYLELSKA